MKPVGPLRALLDKWRQDAETFRRCGAIAQAEHSEAYCRELEEALVRAELETLTVREAAAESGYSASQLRRTFHGQKRIRRGDLPRKPKHGRAA